MKKLIIYTFFALFSYNAMAVEYSSVISIDVTDKNATSAKEKAWSHANRVALNNVMQKISQNVSLDYLSDEEILNLVKQTEVLSEKNSNTRYIGKLKVVFNKKVLDNFLKEKNIQRIDVYTSRVLLIPIYKDPTTQEHLVWQNENKLRNAFEGKPSKGVVKIEPIKPIASNYFLSDPDKLLQKDIPTLTKIARDNLVQDVFIIFAQNVGNNELSSEIIYYKNGSTQTKTITSTGTEEYLYDSAVMDISNYINSTIKQSSINIASSEQSLNVIYNFNTLEDWVFAKKLLQKINYIKKVSPVAMQTNKVEFKIDYIGDYNQLFYAIQSKGYNIKKDSGYYILERI